MKRIACCVRDCFLSNCAVKVCFYTYLIGGIPNLQVSGGLSDGVPPVPFSNTVVKAARADNTWEAIPWEDRSSPE